MIELCLEKEFFEFGFCQKFKFILVLWSLNMFHVKLKNGIYDKTKID